MKKRLTCIFWIALFFLQTLQTASAQKAADTNYAKSFINRNALKLGFSAADLYEYRILNAHTDAGSGLLLVYIQQTYKGLDVNRAVQTLSISNDSIFSFAGNRFRTHVFLANSSTGNPVITAAQALQAALHHLNIYTAREPAPVVLSNNEICFGNLDAAANNITAKLLWLPDAAKNRLSLAWQVSIQPKGTADFWLVNTDATDGKVINKENITVTCNWNNAATVQGFTMNNAGEKNKNAAKEKKPGGDFNSALYYVIPFPAESPSHPGGGPAEELNPWEKLPKQKTDKYIWQYDGDSIHNYTKGNNVLAHEDVQNNDFYGDTANSGTPLPDLNFHFTFDSTKEPSDSSNQNFAITNLFYWNNTMHDVMMLYGFDESNGNFQKTNFTNDGLGNDFVYADAQDGGGSGNASFLTQPDGQSPRMQLYLFDGKPKRDPDLDNGIICHEYAHGISNRMIGGPSITTCLTNEEQMGEGWSDYFALMMTTDWSTAKPGDGRKKRSIATYALGQSPDGPGVRIHSYSTDTTADPWTYADLPNVPHVGSMPDPHAVGEIWCTALWDMTWALIDEYGITPSLYDTAGTGGNIIAMKIVTLGLALTPCSPGFEDAKKALLHADNKRFDRKYDCIIKNAFARRGMGAYFMQGSSFSYTDGTVDFTEPIDGRILSIQAKDTAVEGEEITYSIELRGGACGNTDSYSVIDTLPQELNYVSGGEYDAVNHTVNFTNIHIKELERDTLYFTAVVKEGTYTQPVLHIDETVPVSELPEEFISDSIAGNNPWTVNTKSHNSSYALYIKDPENYTVTALETKDSIFITGKTTLSFWQSYNTEQLYDGGVVEISTDNGITWIDLGLRFSQNGYNTIISGLYGSYLADRYAFCGNSNGYIQSIADLSEFRNQYIKLRFLFATDNGGKGYGWNIDDIVLKSEAAAYNQASLFDGSGNLIFSNTKQTVILPGVLSSAWANFTAQKNGGTALLNWQFLQNDGTEKFIIQRAADGIHFINIGYVTASEYQSHNYFYTDAHPLTDVNYYRIQQTSASGSASYSPVRALNFKAANTITITPNPAKDKLLVTIPGNNAALQISLFTMAGQRVCNYTISEETNWLQLPALSKGMYYLKITGNTFSSSHKILIE